MANISFCELELFMSRSWWRINRKNTLLINIRNNTFCSLPVGYSNVANFSIAFKTRFGVLLLHSKKGL